MVSRNTTLVPSLVLRIGQACEAGLSVGMRRESVPPQKIKTKIKTPENFNTRPHSNKTVFLVLNKTFFTKIQFT